MLSLSVVAHNNNGALQLIHSHLLRAQYLIYCSMIFWIQSVVCTGENCGLIF